MAIITPGNVNGISYEHQRVFRSKGTITFRHGLGDDSSLFHDLIKVAQDNRYSTLAINSPGHGQSKYGSVINQDPENLAAILDACNIRRTNIAGFSLGATQALHFAYHHPERVGKMLLLAPVFFDKEYLKPLVKALLPIYEVMKELCPPPTEERVARNTDFRYGPTNIYGAFLQRIKATGPRTMIAALRELEELGIPDYLKHIHHEVKIVAGKNDQLATRETIERLENDLGSHVRTQWLDAGHVIIIEDKKREKTIEALVASFLCH